MNINYLMHTSDNQYMTDVGISSEQLIPILSRMDSDLSDFFAEYLDADDYNTIDIMFKSALDSYDFKHFEIYYTIDQLDDEYIYSANSVVEFKFNEDIIFDDDFYNIDNDEDSIASIDEKNVYIKLHKLFKTINYYGTKEKCEFTGHIKVKDDGTIIITTVMESNKYSGNIFSQEFDDFENFLSDSFKFDSKYATIKKILYNSFKSAGFIENKTETKYVELLTNELKSFEPIKDTDNTEYVLLSDLNIITKQSDDNTIIKTSKFKQKYIKFLDNYITTYFKLPTNISKQLEFDNLTESKTYVSTDILKKYDISVDVELNISPERYGYNNLLTSYLNLYINVTFINNSTYQLLKFLDNNSEDLINYAKLLTYDILKIENEHSIKLKQLYKNLI